LGRRRNEEGERRLQVLEAKDKERKMLLLYTNHFFLILQMEDKQYGHCC
jgi:hypothetical protein